MTCQSLISDLSDVESPSAATARMHLLRRFSRYGPEKLAPHAGGPCVCGERLRNGCSTSLFWSRSCRAGRDSDFGRVFGGVCTTDFLQLVSEPGGATDTAIQDYLACGCPITWPQCCAPFWARGGGRRDS